MTFDQVVFGATILFGIGCAGVFAFSVWGRSGADGWESRKLNAVALLSGLAAAGVCVFLVTQGGSVGVGS